MKKYEIISISEEKKWENIVKSFKNYDIFYLPTYVKAFQMHGDGEPLLFYYNNNNNTKAIDVIMKRDIANNKKLEKKIEKNQYYDLSSPYGYGGFIIEGLDYEDVNNTYDNFCKENNIICEFVRFNLFDNYYKKYNGEVLNIKKNIIRKINMTPKEMLMDFEHKVRKNLKKAEFNGLQIQIDEKGESLSDFLEIYYNTMKRNNAEKEYYFKKEFFTELNKMKNNIIYFNVLYNNKIISTELVIYTKKNCYSYLGGTLDNYFNLRPNDFLKYEIIKWAYNKGLENFILGGGYSNKEDDGILKYKKSFAPKDGLIDFYIGKKIFNKELYEKLLNIRKEEENFNINSTFFPVYRS